MEIKTILFDLDGTLLPMDQDRFIGAYMKGLAQKAVPHGYDPKKFVDAVWMGTALMIQNDGKCRNEEVFWKHFYSVFGKESAKDKPVFDDFYRNEFQQVSASCGYDPRAAKLIEKLKEKGFHLVLATNPLFPQMATHSRVRWAGMNPEEFDWITTYENASFCKPNIRYYEEIIGNLNLDPAQCLMVGNDVDEDMIAEKLGMRVFLLTDYLLNKHNLDISAYPQGSFEALEAYIDSL